MGSAIVQYAITWHITLTTKSGLMLTYATLCGFLPQILISLFAGVWADRFNRKKLIILADGLIAVFTALLAVLFAMGYQYIWLLFLISAIRSIGAGIQGPAVGAYLTEFVPKEKLMKVNGINASIQNMMFLFAPVVAGGIYSFLGLGPVFLVDVVPVERQLVITGALMAVIALLATRFKAMRAAGEPIAGELAAEAEHRL